MVLRNGHGDGGGGGGGVWSRMGSMFGRGGGGHQSARTALRGIISDRPSDGGGSGSDTGGTSGSGTATGGDTGGTGGSGTAWYPTLRGSYWVRIYQHGRGRKTHNHENPEQHLQEKAGGSVGTMVEEKEMYEHEFRLCKKEDEAQEEQEADSGGNDRRQKESKNNLSSSTATSFPTTSSSDEGNTFPSMTPPGDINVDDRVKVLWANGRWYQGTVTALFREGGVKKGLFGKVSPVIEYACVEYDDQETRNEELYLCTKYSGLLPPLGLYFTEGDLVVVESDLGSTYSESGVVVEIEASHVKRYSRRTKRKTCTGPFGVFKVQITEGANKGHVLHGVRSEDLRRRCSSSRKGGRSSSRSRQEQYAVEIGTVRVATIIPVAPVVRGGGGGGGGGGGSGGGRSTGRGNRNSPNGRANEWEAVQRNGGRRNNRSRTTRRDPITGRVVDY